MSEPIPHRDLAALEAALGALAPCPGSINRDQLLFRAGQYSVRRHWWLCPVVALASAAASLSFVLFSPTRQSAQNVVYVAVAAPVHEVIGSGNTVTSTGSSPAPEESPPLGAIYLRLEHQLLRWGLDALASSPPAPATSPALTLDSLIDASPPVRQPPSRLLREKFLRLGDRS